MAHPPVIFLLNSLGLGGSERKVTALAATLASEGHEVGCAWMCTPDTLESSLPPAVSRWFLDRKSRLSWSVIRRLRAVIGEQRAVVASVNQYPAIYAAVLQKLAPRRVAATLCLMNTATFERTRDHWFRPLYSWALRNMDTVIYGSEAQRALWDAPGTASWSRSRVLYNGVDLKRFDFSAWRDEQQNLRRSFGIASGRFVFGSTGRLASEKNYPALVEALAGVVLAGVDAQLLLAGEGPLRKQLENRAAELGIADRIILIGRQDDVRPALAAMDVFVLPSTNETFSNSALEAMAMSRPAILSHVGGAPEMVTDGVEGWLLPLPTLVDDLVQRLTELARDPARGVAMGIAARTRVESQFSDAQMLAQYRSLLLR